MAAILLGTLGMALPAHRASAQVSISVNVSLGGFYDELSPHGDWIDCSYGECWVPRGVPAGWQPYSNGEWIYTRYGWTWVSDDPWGNDPYHYGTWAFVGRHGWVWVPGTVWAPAWVTWSYSDRYVGWAPMPPTMTFGTSGYYYCVRNIDAEAKVWFSSAWTEPLASPCRRVSGSRSTRPD